MKKVIVFDFSPRKNGNSDVITNTLVEKIQDAEVKTVYFRDTPIAPCKACNACKMKDTAFCVQKDVMGEMLEELDQCDEIVMVSPIYFGRLSAPALMFIDRLYSFFNPAKENGTNCTKFGKKAALLCTCGAGPVDVYTKYAEETVATLGVMGATENKVLVCGNVNGVGEVAEHAEDMAKVEELAAWL